MRSGRPQARAGQRRRRAAIGRWRAVRWGLRTAATRVRAARSRIARARRELRRRDRRWRRRRAPGERKTGLARRGLQRSVTRRRGVATHAGPRHAVGAGPGRADPVRSRDRSRGSQDGASSTGAGPRRIAKSPEHTHPALAGGSHSRKPRVISAANALQNISPAARRPSSAVEFQRRAAAHRDTVT